MPCPWMIDAPLFQFDYNLRAQFLAAMKQGTQRPEGGGGGDAMLIFSPKDTANLQASHHLLLAPASLRLNMHTRNDVHTLHQLPANPTCQFSLISHRMFLQNLAACVDSLRKRQHISGSAGRCNLLRLCFWVWNHDRRRTARALSYGCLDLCTVCR